MRISIAIVTFALPLAWAHADEGEMRLAITPGATVLLRHGHTNIGFGGRARWSFGLEDFVDLEATMGCDHLANMEGPAVSSTGIEGSVVYDATRCLVAPGAAIRYGRRFVVSAALGLGYRVEVRSGQELGAEGVLLERPDKEVRHEFVAVGRIVAEYRLTPAWSFGGFVELTAVLAGALTELDLNAGVFVAAHFYP